LWVHNRRSEGADLKQRQAAVKLSGALKKWNTVKIDLGIFHFTFAGGGDFVRTALDQFLYTFFGSRVFSGLKSPKRDHEGQTYQIQEQMPHRVKSVTILNPVKR